MADWKKGLPPIMKNKLAEIGEVTEEEKKRMKELEKLDSVLRDFFKGQLNVQGLWNKLKEFERQGKQYLLRDAYTKLKNSFKWKGLPIKFEEKGDGTLSVEFREKELEEKDLVLELTDGNFDGVCPAICKIGDIIYGNN